MQSWTIQAQKFSAGNKHATSLCRHLGAAADAGGTRHGRLLKEAGLGTNQDINYTLTAQPTATYVCANKGGTDPSG